MRNGPGTACGSTVEPTDKPNAEPFPPLPVNHSLKPIPPKLVLGLIAAPPAAVIAVYLLVHLALLSPLL